MREFVVAFRRLRHQPSFAAAAIITLALGIAAPTALFAVVNATLLRPLPYPHYQDIHTVRTTMTDGRFTIGLVASEEMRSLRRATDAIVASTLTQRRDETILTEAGARQVTSVGVSEGFFELFGLPMASGRAFTAEDHAAGPLSRVVLSHRAWRTMFGGNPSAVGTTIRFAGGSALVVGVAPDPFAIPREADLWFAQRNADSIGHAFDAYVRFKPGLGPAAIAGRLRPMWEELAKKYPDQATNRIFVMRPLLDAMVGDLGPIVVIAFAATGLLLLLAIVNVANLLLARGATRSREVAVRAALGATRWDIVRPLLAESLLIALAATAAGLPLAGAAIRAIVLMGGSALPRVEGMQLDPLVFLFSAIVMVIAGVLVGLAPASTMARVNLADVVNEGGRGGLHGPATRRVLGAMIVLEVTIAIALVAGAGRLLLSMQHLLAIDPGFSSEGRLAIDVLLPPRPYTDPTRLAAWQQEADRRLRSIGATAIGVASSLPFGHEWDSTAFVDITNRPTAPANRPNGRVRVVSPGFFDVFGMKIIAGRPFTLDDRLDAAPVVLVNRAWARKFIPDLDPLRERVSPGRFARRVGDRWVAQDAAIVGVVEDVPYLDLRKGAEPTVYVSDAQVPTWRRSIVITSADGRPERLVPQIRAELEKLDPDVPVEFESLSRVVSTSLTWPKLGLLMMGTFGIAALILSATGVYGVIAFVSAQRSGEMAVRLALGATGRQIFRLIVQHGGSLAMRGVVLGVLVAWAMGRLMGNYVYEVSAGNSIVLGGSAAVVLMVALGATLPSARRAATTQPARALRAAP
jgi:putative ABC transport system permease protein